MAGRTFRPVTQQTFAQHLYLMNLVREVGLHHGLALDDADAAEALLTRVVTSERACDLLAATLVEVQTDGTVSPWTRPGAQSLARWFEGLTNQADFTALQLVLAGLLSGFFAGARSSSATSAPASSGPVAAVSGSVTSTGTVAISTSANGAASSAPSPAGIPAA